MKILITGGAGFIGSHLCEYLLYSGHHIVVLDNLFHGTLFHINHLIGHSNFNFYEGSILDPILLERVFKEEKLDMVFHLAANADIQAGICNPNIDFSDTFLTTYYILLMMANYNVKKIVFASTSAVYGEYSAIPLSEDKSVTCPISNYGAAKLASEVFIRSFVELYDFQAWICRFSNVVGPRMTHGIIFDLRNKLVRNFLELEVLGDGEQDKPYIYVTDVVEAILFIWLNSHDRLNVYNIGVSTGTKVKDIVRMLLEETNLPTTIKYTGGRRGWPGDVPVFSYDLSKLTALGWIAKRTSDEAIRRAIKDILGKL